MEKQKVRIMDERGELYYCRWCNKHSHGLFCDCKESKQWKEISKFLNCQRKRIEVPLFITPYTRKVKA